MDSRLDFLNLPVLKPHIHGPRVADLEGPNSPYRVASLIDHYFEWVGTFESSAYARITRSRNINSCANATKAIHQRVRPRTYYGYEKQLEEKKVL
jgi:hypothetical protein